MEKAKGGLGDKIVAGVLIGSAFYAVGFIPITLCRICLSILSLFTGRWRKVGFPSLSEGGFTGLAVVWVLAAPALFAQVEKRHQTYDYDVVGDKLSFTKAPNEPGAYLRENPEAKLILTGSGKDYKISGKTNGNLVVLDGPQVLSPRDHSDPKQAQVWIGLFIILLGVGGFFSGVFRKHE